MNTDAKTKSLISKESIDEKILFIRENKSNCRGILAKAAKEFDCSNQHVYKIINGTAPESLQNFAILHFIYNEVKATTDKLYSSLSIDPLPAA